MKARLKTPLALAAISGLFGCTVLPQAIDRNLDLTPGKGALAIQLMPQRTTLSLADIDHLTVTVQTVDAIPSQTLTSAALTNGGASASVTFASLTPCIATISLGAFDATTEIGSASATVSIHPLMISRVNMDLTVPGSPATPVGILLANTTIVDSHYRTTTLAGKGTKGYSDGVGTEAQFSSEGSTGGMTMDANGNLFAIDYDNWRIRKITPSGVVTTFAGNGIYSSNVDGIGTSAGFDHPLDIAIAPNGDFFVPDYWGVHRIHKVTPQGVSTTFVETIPGKSLKGIAIDSDGFVYAPYSTEGSSPYYPGILKISPQGVVNILAGGTLAEGFADGTGTAASFYGPQGIALDTSKNLYVADASNHRIRKITPEGVVTTFAGSGRSTSEDGIGTSASFSYPNGLTFDSSGNLYVTESTKIRKITPAGIVTTIAGSEYGYADADSGLRARFSYPRGIVIAQDGVIYVNDGNHVIRKLVP